jgi:hypothetical protein
LLDGYLFVTFCLWRTKMRYLLALALVVCAVGSVVHADPIAISDDEINKILKAKEIVRGMVNYPDTLVFHDLYTKVSGNTVTLKFTARDAFGVPETHTKDIKVN